MTYQLGVISDIGYVDRRRLSNNDFEMRDRKSVV